MDKTQWLLWRRQGLGGSDAPIVMGDSKYTTALQLFEQKISDKTPEEKSNFVAERGNRFEPKIRSLFNLLKGKNFEPALLESGDIPFMRVSLDGRDGDEIIEIKTAGKEDHLNVIAGKVPAQYVAQVQHELIVNNAKVCHYISYWDEEWDEKNISADHMAVIEVYPDLEYQATLIAKETEFWECVKNKKPPIASDKDYVTLKGMAKIANKWKRAKLKLEKIKEELEEAREELIKAAEERKHPRCEVAGVKIYQTSKVGNVDNKKVIGAYEDRVNKLTGILDKNGLLPECFEMAPISTDSYRGKGSTSWTVET